MILHTKITN